MADEWISLSRSFEMMLASEKDSVLVERLLVPALWNGTIPAISRRALVEGARVKDLKIITKKEWTWEESPIVFDWVNSRAWLPAGFHRPTRTSESVRIPRTEYYVIEINLRYLLELIPEIDKFEKSKSSRPGRPNVVKVFAPELERRAEAGERHSTQNEWASALIDWYHEAYGINAPTITPKSITNEYGKRFSQLKPAAHPTDPPKPKTK